jgi:glycosyltransferase involved in cell wall biosynthesis
MSNKRGRAAKEGAMNIVHLTASRFYGGPERQMLGLARALPPYVRNVFLSFSEGGHCGPFLDTARGQGFEARALVYDTPRLRAAAGELAEYLAAVRADVLLCNGYKADLLGRMAARRVGIPAVAVSRGWTAQTLRVRLYEAVDRWHLRRMDRVVCVSEAQAVKVRQAGVPPQRVRVIHNAVDPARFANPDPRAREQLAGCFRRPPARLIGAAGRFSPEKGFDVLVAAAARVLRTHPDTGFLLFGAGSCRAALQQQIAAAGLSQVFVLDGFRTDLDRFVPHFDLLVLPSYSEGLPNIVLEACAAGVPVVATTAGGTPEILADGAGILVPPGNSEALADGIIGALDRGALLKELGEAGRRRVAERFTFAAQAALYQELFAELCPLRHADAPGVPAVCEVG